MLFQRGCSTLLAIKRSLARKIFRMGLRRADLPKSTIQILGSLCKPPYRCNCELASLPLIFVAEISTRCLKLNVHSKLFTIISSACLASCEVGDTLHAFYFSLESPPYLPSFRFQLLQRICNTHLQMGLMETLRHWFGSSSGKLHYIFAGVFCLNFSRYNWRFLLFLWCSVLLAIPMRLMLYRELHLQSFFIQKLMSTT